MGLGYGGCRGSEKKNRQRMKANRERKANDMSIAGYLSARPVWSRMPADAGKQIGAEFRGEVLGGKLTAAEELGLSAVETVGPVGERYFDVEEYDPVLRAHCRLDGA